jgi:endonuclease/exonuclease/phosphatase (EEP) superfamily protein YafD
MTIVLVLLFITAIAIVSSRVGWCYQLERFSHFQIQYWFGVFLLTIWLLIDREQYLALIGFVSLFLLSINIFTWPLPDRAASLPLVKVLFANVWSGNHHYADILAMVRSESPDLAIFVEVNTRWRQELDSLADLLPYCRSNHRGEVFYSKIDLAGTEIVEQDLSFGHTLIVRHLQHRGQRFTVVVTHPPSPRNVVKFVKRNQHLENLGWYLDRLTDNLIVVGDFNTTPWSPYYRKLMNCTRLVSARSGWGVFPTWTHWRVRLLPKCLQPVLSLPIDHILTRSGALNMCAISFDTGSDIGSDHLPIIAEIGWVNTSAPALTFH